jgi:uncharacterized protein (TIGR03000 family)
MTKKSWYSIALLAAGVGLLLTPETSQAQRRWWRGGWSGGYGYGQPYYGGLGSGYGWYGYPGGYGSSPYSSYRWGGYPVYGGYYGNYQPGYSGTAPGAGYDSETAGQSATQSGAGFVVRLPAPNAEVWFGDYKTQQQGTVRRFESGALEPGQPYTFHVRARWMREGQPVDQTRDVQAQAGQTVTVDFTAPQRRGVPPATKPQGE